jgi:exopolysaccharide biosynthesis protein
VSEIEEIKQVITESYIEGVHRQVDINLMKKGIHSAMRMQVLDKDQITEFEVEAWHQRLANARKDNPDLTKVQTDYEIEVLDITNSAAVVRIKIFKDKKQVFTDYFSMYCFSDGWKIMNKIYATH